MNMNTGMLGPYADFLDPQYWMQVLPVSLDMIPASLGMATGSPYLILGLPEQLNQSMHVSAMDLQTLPGGIEYLSWLISAFLQAFGVYV